MTAKQKNLVDAFFKAEYNKLVNYVRKSMSNKYYDASPEDIIQDVALGLLAKLDLNAQIENLAGYIYRSLRNRIIDTKRKTRNNIPFESYANKQNEYQSLDEFMVNAEQEEENHINIIEPEILHEAISKALSS